MSMRRTSNTRECAGTELDEIFNPQVDDFLQKLVFGSHLTSFRYGGAFFPMYAIFLFQFLKQYLAVDLGVHTNPMKTKNL